jgi:WD40 repeat protein
MRKRRFFYIIIGINLFCMAAGEAQIELQHVWTRLADSEGAVDESRGTASAEAAEFSPDGSLIVAGSKGRMVGGERKGQRVTLWDVEGNLLWERPRADEVEAVAFSPDGRFIAAGGEDRLVEIHQIHDERGQIDPALVASLEHDAGIDGLRFSHDGKLLATGAEDQKVRLYGTRSWERLTTESHGGRGENAVNQLDFTSEDSRLVTAGSNGKLRIWDLSVTQDSDGNISTAKLTLIHELDQKASSKSVRISPDDKYIASGAAGEARAGGAQGTWIWDFTGNLVAHIQATGWIIEAVEWSPGGRYLLTGGNEGEVDDAGNGRFALKGNKLEHDRHGVGHIHVYRLEDILAGTLDPVDPVEVLNVDPETFRGVSGELPGEPIAPVLRHQIFRQEYLHFSPDGTQLITSHEDGTIRLFNVVTE